MSEPNEIPASPRVDSAGKVPDVLPILPNPDYVLFPSMIAPLIVSSPAGLQMVDEIARGDRFLGLFAVKPAPNGEDHPEKLEFEHLYEVGTAATILRMLKTPEGSVRLLVHGVSRVRIRGAAANGSYLKAEVDVMRTVESADTETQALRKSVLLMLKSYIDNSQLTEEVHVAATNMDDAGKLADLIASNLSIGVPEQQAVLELEDPKARLHKVHEILARELEIAALGTRIQTQIKSKMERHQRDYILREQIKAIRRELGEQQDEKSEVEDVREQIAKAKLPEHARKVAEKEVARLENIPTTSPEYTVSRTYLSTILSLPWDKTTRDNIHLKKARKILDADHYDLEKVKDRILEYLAVIKLRKSLKGPILCLVGPPGVGKTSLGRSVARSMGRKFARISLGGMRDEAEIRGHRRTYIGAMPGRIISAIKDCGASNPVLMLDEIDKLGADFRGDPASALLEVLDPEQNFSFTDHYLDIPYDLSKVMFITTSNMLETIPGPLLDRMEVLRLSGYTLGEKVHIAKKYLIPRALENSGLPAGAVVFTDEGLEAIIERYTREAGLRNLEREITNICRKVARRIAEGKKGVVRADAKHIEEALGPHRFSRDDAARANKPGMAVGLAWTPSGGDILFIESTATPGEGRLTLTGQLGDVMKESAQAALTFLQSGAQSLKIPVSAFRRQNLHIHVPAGAVPKDGPSAGVAIALSLASLLVNRALKPRLAMTGEITLKGSVLPVGGIKEKVLAAHRSGIRELILPKENERDLNEIPAEIARELKFNFVEDAGEAMAIGLGMKSAPAAKPRAAKPAAASRNGRRPAARRIVRKRSPSRR